MGICRHKTTDFFFLLRSTGVTTVTAPVNLLSNTTIFITSVVVNERLNHTQLKITTTPMFMTLLFRLLVKPCHHLHPHLFNNIYTLASRVSARTALKVCLRHLDRILFLFVVLLWSQYGAETWVGFFTSLFLWLESQQEQRRQSKNILIHILGVDHTVLHANCFWFSGVFCAWSLNQELSWSELKLSSLEEPDWDYLHWWLWPSSCFDSFLVHARLGHLFKLSENWRRQLYISGTFNTRVSLDNTGKPPRAPDIKAWA